MTVGSPGGDAGPNPVPSIPVLSVRALSVSYGGVNSLTDVDLSVGAGEIVGLIGPNGAGKTTMIDALSGFVRHKQGWIELGG
ncbi:MAG TPA: ATP-binding cassette domain-containing protein, partial [Ilumatobacteraceae bacterium]|nr:ATP-binding cassette domain-containing protein [Ilumatobacteraceae bacterium]